MDPAIAVKMLSLLMESCADIEEVRGSLGELGGVWSLHISRCIVALEQIQAALARESAVVR